MSGGGATVPRQYLEESEVTGWVGWIVFAAIPTKPSSVWTRGHGFNGQT